MTAVATWIATVATGLLPELTHVACDTGKRIKTTSADHAPRLPDPGFAGTELTAEAVDSSVDTSSRPSPA